jgi:hypothetical protein
MTDRTFTCAHKTASKVADYLNHNHDRAVINLVDDVIADLLKVWPTLTIDELINSVVLALIPKDERR